MVPQTLTPEHSPSVEMFPLKDARRFQPYDERTHIATLIRHISKGSKAIDGRTVKLKAMKYPRGFRTCEAWIKQFFEDLNTPGEVAAAKAVKPAVDGASQKARAAAYLDAMKV